MGDYNSYQPTILGQEWVPIRDEDQVFSPAVNTIEVGHRFTLTTARTLQDARFYINDPAPGRGLGQVLMAAVYPSGAEDETGPIKRLVIPCNSGGITGSTVSLSNATTVDQAVFDPSDNKSIIFSGAGSGLAQFFFATNSYATPLIGKRILAVNLLYSTAIAVGAGNSTVGPGITIEDDAGNGVFNTYGTMTGPDSLSQVAPIGRARFGEINQFWSTTLSPNNTTDRMPWIWSGLQRFEASATARIRVMLRATTVAGDDIRVGYMALEVIYCEEQRIALGGRSFGESALSGQNKQYVPGVNIIPMRTIGQVANPVLAVGNYTLVLSSPDLGDYRALTSFPVVSTTYPDLNAVRELYAIPAHPGIQVDIPFPVEDHLGDTFTQTTTHILPQLSLHTSGGTMTEPHAYGRQIAAQVYGANTATQEIYDDISGVAADYPQVRFYARRFGDTTVPLTLTGVGGLSASTVSLTVAEFDALTDIIDGWKEVTLRFATVPSMGTVAGNPAWTWSAVGEIAGNRWEILGACAPAVSGIPGNLFNQVSPTTDRLGVATYQPPAGDTVELTWMPQGCSSPYVSGSTIDPAVDAFLIFSQDPPTVTGISLSQLTQTVTGIGLDCGSLPCCIPSGIGYNRVTWGLPVNTGIASDDFNRTVAAGSWGTASDGKTWTTSGTAGDFSVNGAEGVIAPTATASNRFAWRDVGGPEQDITCLVKIADLAETSTLNTGVVGRLTDANNNYGVEFRYDTGGTTVLMLRKRVAGVATDLVSITVPGINPNVVAWRWLRFQITGSQLRTKVWGLGQPEPDWMLATTDTSLTTGNNAGCFARDNTTAAAPSAFSFESFSVAPPDYTFGALELQRLDTVDFNWQTIMLTTSPTVTGFNDYEARVGISSVYRIRNLNVYNFAGPWSTTVTGAPPTPGVTGGCSDQTGALIFTSNAMQSGGSNAAYVMQWEGFPDEIFQLPEADDVVFQPMYGRDGRVAFHGTERGLETFDRTLLIQAAAIDPVRLADVKTLRDLAWNDLPYICVRDDIGDRWYANVRVPTTSARFNRTKYMARVSIVETTTTPFAVDP